MVNVFKFQTLLFLLSNKILVIRAGIHKMLVRIVSMEDFDQTSSSSLIWVHTVCLGYFVGQLMFKRETDKH